MAGVGDKSLMKLNIENVKLFQASIREALKKVDDLSIPFGLISADFYKSQKAIFQLKSAGGYQDLNEDYKKRKLKGDKRNNPAAVYPILKRSGRLEESLSSPDADEAIYKISKKAVIIGTSVPYGIFHNSDDPRSKIPHRKFLFIAPESKEFGKKQPFAGRLQRWTNIIQRFVEEAVAAKGGV